ncbi:MAG: helix-turn-helix transcriptional regulator [Planctomycetaceae bacterium]
MRLPADYDELRLIDVKVLSKLLCISNRTVWRMLSSGSLIEPIRIGGSVRWRLCEVERWIASGCPPPDQTAR